jgi:uncharacterized protein DUF3617
MLRHRGLLVAPAVAFVFVASAPAGAVDMQEGLWEITTRMEMPGMPAGMGAHTVQQCVTKQDTADPSRTMPKDDHCTLADFKTSGNTVTWSVVCKGEGDMTGTGSMTYRGSSYDGTMNVQMRQGGQTMAMTQHIAGRRIGPCR